MFWQRIRRGTGTGTGERGAGEIRDVPNGKLVKDERRCSSNRDRDGPGRRTEGRERVWV